MTIVDTFPQFVTASADYADADKVSRLRVGQRVMLLLMRVRPDMHALMEGSDFDCTFDDDRMPLAYDYIMRHWNDDML